MTNAKAQKPNAGVSTEPEATTSPARRTDVALKPATPLEVLVSRALDQELEWYFEYAEGALHRESVGMLPSYAVVRILADGMSAALPRRGQCEEPTDEACRSRAHELARTVQGCLSKVPGRHASVLRAAYTPRRWPSRV